MRLAIDASNIRGGGGLTHLRCFLDEVVPNRHGVERVFVWASSVTLSQLPAKPWLDKVHEPLLERAMPWRAYWQQFRLPSEVVRRKCQALFSPGSTLPFRILKGTFTMSQNLLPFEPAEAARFGVGSPMWLKMKALRLTQGLSMRRADGVIFLTGYAQTLVVESLGGLSGRRTVIAHGVEDRFRVCPRPQLAPNEFSQTRPFRFLYVSMVDAYKHQTQVAAAVASLRRLGFPIGVDFVGPGRPQFLKELLDECARVDPGGSSIRWRGEVSNDVLHDVYRETDAFVFASSCENLPNILVEAMAAGLPIACSRRGPMPEVLGDAGVYFEPESIEETAGALRALFENPELRADLAARAYHKAQEYSWKRCADQTLAFIAEGQS